MQTMNWRIVANGAALVVAISSVASANSDAGTASAAQKFVANDARAILATIRVENEYKSGYRRSFFDHWSDLNGDGCDTREEVLKRDSISKPQVDPYRCYVVAGDWFSKYDGKKLTDRSDVDIDHVVALKEAWDSGAWSWSDSQRKAFANDMTDSRTLIAVSDRVNMSKGDKDPSNWMPPQRSYWCTYLGDWISIKARWALSMDQSEYGRIKNLLATDCSTLTISSWNAAPVLAPPVVATTSTTTSTSNTTATTSTTAKTTAPINTATTVAGSSTTVSGSTGTTVATGAKDIYPGSYCAPVDALGTFKGNVYVCSKTNAEGSPYAGGRARWRKATN